MQYKELYKRMMNVTAALRRHAHWSLLDGGLQDRFNALIVIFKEFPDGLPEKEVKPLDFDNLRNLIMDKADELLKDGKYTPARLKEFVVKGIDFDTVLDQFFATAEPTEKLHPKMPKSALVYSSLKKKVLGSDNN